MWSGANLQPPTDGCQDPGCSTRLARARHPRGTGRACSRRCSAVPGSRCRDQFSWQLSGGQPTSTQAGLRPLQQAGRGLSRLKAGDRLAPPGCPGLEGPRRPRQWAPILDRESTRYFVKLQKNRLQAGPRSQGCSESARTNPDAKTNGARGGWSTRSAHSLIVSNPVAPRGRAAQSLGGRGRLGATPLRPCAPGDWDPARSQARRRETPRARPRLSVEK